MFRPYRMTRLSDACIALAASVVLAAPASAGDMILGEAAPAPIGYVEFCKREPAECPGGARATAGFDQRYWALAFREPAGAGWARAAWAPGGSAATRPAARITYTEAAFADLERVNRDVNRRMIATPDRLSHRQEDRWDLPLSRGDRRGDCEDYVLEKRHQLIALGYPEQALSIALVRTRWNESHAVLLAETTHGALVLDSFSPWVSPWANLSYRWLLRQSPDDPSAWVTVVR